MSGYFQTSDTSHHNKKKGSWNSRLFLLGLVLTWYVCAVVTITTSKEIMNRLKFPFLLCCIQFAFAALLSFAYLTISGSLVSIYGGVRNLVTQISFSYTFGFILTNSAFSIVSAGFAETIKSAEPLSTVMIGFILLKEVNSAKTYSTLIPICLGVGLSCYHNEDFNVYGFLLAAASNVCFSGRAVLAKKLHVNYPDSLDEINLFAYISLIGLVFLIPITAMYEGSALLDLYHTSGENADLNLNNSIFAGSFSTLFLINGSMFAVYNLMSYVVLKHTDLVTHSVLNCFRRVFIIVFTSLYFGLHLSLFNMTGISIAVLGVMLFGYFRAAEKAKPLL